VPGSPDADPIAYRCGKAYTTRVGGRSLSHRIEGSLKQDSLADRGHEFRHHHGRRRSLRVGLMGVIRPRYAVGGQRACDCLAITSSTLLDELDSIQVCVPMRLDGEGASTISPAAPNFSCPLQADLCQACRVGSLQRPDCRRLEQLRNGHANLAISWLN